MRSSNDFWFWVVVALIIMSLQVTGTIVRFLVSPPGLVICGIIFLIFLILKSSSGGDSQLPAESSTPTEDMRAQALAEQEAALEVAREAARERERLRMQHRDADMQQTPYLYRCVGHPNKTLALRYGLVNRLKESDRMMSRWRDGETIRIKKKGMLKPNMYLAELPDFANRKVKVVIEKGTENVKTFYPWSEDWFEKHADLELVLKDNKAFTLKELANFHVQKTVKGV